MLVDPLAVDISFGYNAIMGRLTMNSLRAIPSTYHQKVKFPIINGVREV